MNTRYGAGDRTRVHYGAPGGNAGWQQSTGLLHLHGFESVPPGYKKENPRSGFSFFGAGVHNGFGFIGRNAQILAL